MLRGRTTRTRKRRIVEFRNRAGRWVELFFDGLLPRHCVLCGLGSGPQNICAPCAAELPRIGHSCMLCGLPLLRESGRFCGACLRRAPPWNRAIAALVYRFPVDRMVHRFKFSRNLACGQILGKELLQAVERKSSTPPSCILPVPLHRTRQFSRVFNQAELLARYVGKGLEIPVYNHVLLKSRRTPAQSGLDAESRKRNLRGAIQCRLPGKLQCKLEHVALVDDVMTTGTTLAECTRTLRRVGAKEISTWVAAVTPANPGK